jgi:hypothetical protein
MWSSRPDFAVIDTILFQLEKSMILTIADLYKLISNNRRRLFLMFMYYKISRTTENEPS